MVYLPFHTSATGNTVIVPASSDPAQKVDVFSIVMQAASGTTFSLTDGVGGSAILGPMIYSISGSLNIPLGDQGTLISTSAGNALVVNISGLGAAVGGGVWFVYA